MSSTMTLTDVDFMQSLMRIGH